MRTRTPLIVLGAVAIVAAVVVALSTVNPVAAPTASPPGASSSAAGSPGAPPVALWPAPPDAMARAVEAGLEPAPKEYSENHVHAHLDVFVDGKPVVIPAGIGINIEDPEVHRFENPLEYGDIQLCAQACISPLHTHDETGILHTESSEAGSHTLGQFFTEWGLELSETCVADKCDPATPIAVYVDGAAYDGDPTAIELTDMKVIVVVVGTPPPVIPSTADFSAA